MSAAIADDIHEEAERLTAEARRAGLGLRLMGGLAIWLTSPSARVAPFERGYEDLDFAVRRRDSRPAQTFLADQGYVPERLFNSIHGAQRLNFGHPEGRWTIDVIIDELRMSHRIDLRGRLEPGPPTLDLADLLLTKLQIWQINAKDLGDVTCLLADHALADAPGGDGAVIDRGRILSLSGADWGLCHTLLRNLDGVGAFARERRPAESAFDPTKQVEALVSAIDGGPKQLSWQMRARIGERVRWYEVPEEVRH